MRELVVCMWNGHGEVVQGVRLLPGSYQLRRLDIPLDRAVAIQQTFGRMRSR